MPVSREGRVQVDSRIHQIEKRSYEAQHVTHIDPQRRESQASNYQRLAHDLGQFNSSLQDFSKGIKDYEKRAEIRAKKLEAERAAAEKRKARGGGGGRSKKKKDDGVGDPLMPDVTVDKDGKPIVIEGDPGFQGRVLGEENATVKTYKEAIDVKRGIGSDFDMNAEQQRIMDTENGYQVDVTDPKTGEPTGEKRMMTVHELQMRHAQIDKAVVERYGNQPLVVRHLRERNKWHLFDAKKALIAAERKDRENTANNFVASTAVDRIKQLQATGATPDQIAEAIQKQNVADAQVISPYFSKQDSDKAVLGALAQGLEDGDPATADATIAFLKGSPASKSGVTSYLKHPKYKAQAAELLKVASKIKATAEAENAASITNKEYINAAMKGENTPLVQDISVPTVGGKPVVLDRGKQLKAIGQNLDQAVQEKNAGKPTGAVIANMVKVFAETPELTSPTLERTLKPFSLKTGEQIDYRDPAYKAANTTAITMLRAGPGGKTMLRKIVPDYMVAFYEMGDMLDRAGIKDPEKVANHLNVFLDNRRKGGTMSWPGDTKKEMDKFTIPGLTAAQQNMVLTVTKMSVLDEDLTVDQIKARATSIAEQVKEYNPVMNGRTYSVPHDTPLPATEFQTSVDLELKKVGAAEGFDASKSYLKRVGNSYVIYDADTEFLRTDNEGRPIAIPFSAVVKDGVARRDKKKADRIADEEARKKASKEQKDYSRKYHAAGGTWGAIGRMFNGESLDDAAERVQAEKLKTERLDLDNIWNEDFGEGSGPEAAPVKGRRNDGRTETNRDDIKTPVGKKTWKSGSSVLINPPGTRAVGKRIKRDE